MRIEKVVEMPALYFGRIRVVPETADWRVVLSQREYDTLAKAAAILEQMADMAAGDDPHGPDQLYDMVRRGDELRCAEAYLSAFVEGGRTIGLTPAALAQHGIGEG